MLAFKIRITLSIIAFVLLTDLYLWQGVKRLLRNSSAQRKRNVKLVYWSIPALLIICSLLFLLVPALESNRYFRNYFIATLFIVYFSKFMALLFLLTDDIRRFGLWAFRKAFPAKTNTAQAEQRDPGTELPAKISRSQFLTSTGMLMGSVPFVMLSKGIAGGAYDYRVRHETLRLPKLPDAFEGLKLLQISDIHSGSFFDKDAVKKGIDLIMAQKADLIFFTGDMVNNKADEVKDYLDIFSAIKAPVGVFSTLGNHDYGDYVSNWPSEEAKRKNLEQLCQAHGELGWRLLRNEHEVISLQGHKLGILGVENWGDRGRFQKYGDVSAAKQGMEEVPVKLLLSHDPSHWDAHIRPGHTDIDATFSGHTHGMQFGIEIGSFKWSPVQYMYKQWAGLYQEQHQYLYVNRGFGFIGYPGRVGILPEITVFTLTKG